MKTIELSIIIPVFNDQDGLDRCLAHLNRQTRLKNNVEIIVVDNCSDVPLYIHKKYLLNIKCIVCCTAGSYAARNQGASVAKGHILAFLDADCVPNKNWIHTGFLATQKYPNSIIGGNIIFRKNKTPTAVEKYQYLNGFGQRTNIVENYFSATANIFVSAKTFNQIGPFNEQLLSGGDCEWCWRARSLNIKILYNKHCIVSTNARQTFTSAAIQARRVAGGRFHLRKLGLTPTSALKKQFAPNRNITQGIIWIFSLNNLSFFDRLKIFAVASMLKTIRILETIKLQLGGQAERR